jgi:hypothetical protein
VVASSLLSEAHFAVTREERDSGNSDADTDYTDHSCGLIIQPGAGKSTTAHRTTVPARSNDSDVSTVRPTEVVHRDSPGAPIDPDRLKLITDDGRSEV